MIYHKFPFSSPTGNANESIRFLVNKEVTFPNDEGGLEIEHLIRGMLNKNVFKRLTIKEVLAHPALNLNQPISVATLIPELTALEIEEAVTSFRMPDAAKFIVKMKRHVSSARRRLNTPDDEEVIHDIENLNSTYEDVIDPKRKIGF